VLSRIEVVETGRRQRWTSAEKLGIVEETFSGPRLVSATARRCGISRQLLLSWRKAWGSNNPTDRSQARHSSLSRMSVWPVAIHTRTPDAMEIIATVHQPAPRPRPSASPRRPRR
jgi:transposase-like protein